MISQSIKLSAIVLATFAVSWFAAHRSANSVSADTVGRVVPTGDMTVPRFDHTATLLPNGKVLIAAGMARDGVPEPTAELYDPRTNRFTPVGKLASPRGWGSTATLLQDGKVLIAGGATGSWCSASCYLATAELYDPSTNTFTRIGNMTEPRAGASAVLLKDGDVLIVGGNVSSDTQPTVTAELYHHATRAFSVAGGPSAGGPVLLLKDGKVLTLSNCCAELYDPSTGHFAASGELLIPRGKFGAALLPDGRVLVAGGRLSGTPGLRSDTEIYNPATGKFTVGPEMNLKRYKLMKATLALRNGEVLIGGGADQPEIYNPVSNFFQLVSGSKLDGYCFSTATQLPNGEVLLTGGYNTSTWVAVDHAWLYQP
ncbi:MAG TPA: kelch repeat-containing protein [Candidatus Acidoferrales bacterium]|nr:kelch repeat-containing protein [Candidatus Acidoferrales bacterium]